MSNKVKNNNNFDSKPIGDKYLLKNDYNSPSYIGIGSDGTNLVIDEQEIEIQFD